MAVFAIRARLAGGLFVGSLLLAACGGAPAAPPPPPPSSQAPASSPAASAAAASPAASGSAVASGESFPISESAEWRFLYHIFSILIVTREPSRQVIGRVQTGQNYLVESSQFLLIQAIGLLLVYRASVQVMIVRAIVAGRCESSVSITKLSLPGDKSDLPGESCMLNKKI